MVDGLSLSLGSFTLPCTVGLWACVHVCVCVIVLLFIIEDCVPISGERCQVVCWKPGIKLQSIAFGTQTIRETYGKYNTGHCGHK